MIELLIAAALAQAAGPESSPPESFAEAEDWSIARHEGGCLMTREFGGEGNTIVTFSVTPRDNVPLTILVANGAWSLPEADDEGYQIEFGGNAAVWADLVARTFTTDDEGDGARDGVISLGFAEDAITPLLADLAGADGLHLTRHGVTVDRIAFDGTRSAVGRLAECVGTLP